MTSWSEHRGPRGAEYDQRWERLAASGENIHGEVDLVMRYEPGSVLDAGCGTGRVAIELDRRGVHVVGTDLDEAMLASARTKAPHLAWIAADLATLDLADDDGNRRRFDLAVLAGNVMIFVAPGTEGAVLGRLATHLVDGGLLVAGFQLGAGRLALVDYDRLAAAAGIALVERFSTWSGDPFTDGADYAVSVHRFGQHAPPVDGR
jgi:SAM-dependent methyltransferase